MGPTIVYETVPAASALGETVRYVTDAAKSAAVATHGLLSLRTAAQEMRATWGGGARTLRGKPHPIGKIVISWPRTGPEPSPGEVLDVARDVLEHIGLARHQWFASAHSDARHRHVHVVVNRVDPDTGELKAQEWLAELFDELREKLERRFPQGPIEYGIAPTRGASDAETWNGRISATRWLREHLARARVGSKEELDLALARRGFTRVKTKSGWCFVDFDHPGGALRIRASKTGFGPRRMASLAGSDLVVPLDVTPDDTYYAFTGRDESLTPFAREHPELQTYRRAAARGEDLGQLGYFLRRGPQTSERARTRSLAPQLTTGDLMSTIDGRTPGDDPRVRFAEHLEQTRATEEMAADFIAMTAQERAGATSADGNKVVDNGGEKVIEHPALARARAIGQGYRVLPLADFKVMLQSVRDGASAAMNASGVSDKEKSTAAEWMKTYQRAMDRVEALAKGGMSLMFVSPGVLDDSYSKIVNHAQALSDINAAGNTPSTAWPRAQAEPLGVTDDIIAVRQRIVSDMALYGHLKSRQDLDPQRRGIAERRLADLKSLFEGLGALQNRGITKLPATVDLARELDERGLNTLLTQAVAKESTAQTNAPEASQQNAASVENVVGQPVADVPNVIGAPIGAHIAGDPQTNGYTTGRGMPPPDAAQTMRGWLDGWAGAMVTNGVDPAMAGQLRKLEEDRYDARRLLRAEGMLVQTDARRDRTRFNDLLRVHGDVTTEGAMIEELATALTGKRPWSFDSYVAHQIRSKVVDAKYAADVLGWDAQRIGAMPLRMQEGWLSRLEISANEITDGDQKTFGGWSYAERNGGGLFVEKLDGNFYLGKGPQDAAIDQALLTMALRHNGVVRLEGDTNFLRRAVERAAYLGIAVENGNDRVLAMGVFPTHTIGELYNAASARAHTARAERAKPHEPLLEIDGIERAIAAGTVRPGEKALVDLASEAREKEIPQLQLEVRNFVTVGDRQYAVLQGLKDGWPATYTLADISDIELAPNSTLGVKDRLVYEMGLEGRPKFFSHTMDSSRVQEEKEVEHKRSHAREWGANEVSRDEDEIVRSHANAMGIS